MRRKFSRRLKQFKSDLREQWRFITFSPIGSHVSDEEKSHEKSQNPKQYFCQEHREEVWKNSKDILTEG